MNRGNRSKAGCWALMLIPWCLTGCGREAVDEDAALRGRAEEFGNLLIRIHDMPELEAKQALGGFIEPSSGQAERIAQYYNEFSAASEKFRIVSQSVTGIRIDSTKSMKRIASGMRSGSNTYHQGQAT